MTLRPLAFYDLIQELVKPVDLIPSTRAGKSCSIDFQLTLEQADLIAMNSDTKTIIMRFSHPKSSTYSNSHHDDDDDSSPLLDDNFPQDLTLSLNGQPVNLPPAISNPNKPNIPPKRLGQHVDLTKQAKLCHFVINRLSIRWLPEPNKTFFATVFIADKIDSQTLLKRITERGEISSDSSKKYFVDSDNEIATTNLRATLLCPLGKVRMSVPCKATTCDHLPCFDALTYLQMNEKKYSWQCPVCYNKAHYSDLRIDGFFRSILETTPPDVTEIILEPNGNWTPVLKESKLIAITGSTTEVITISDDDSDG